MIKTLLAILGVASLLGLSQFVPVSAASPITTFAACPAPDIGSFLGFKTWDSCLQHTPAGAPKLNNLNDIWRIVLAVLEDAMKAAAYASVGFIIWGGVKYTKSQGEPSELTAARTIIYNALLGLIITVLSVAIVNLVAGAF